MATHEEALDLTDFHALGRIGCIAALLLFLFFAFGFDYWLNELDFFEGFFCFDLILG